MKTTTYKKVCAENNLEYIETVSKQRNLNKDEYYALMVTDSSSSPHTRGLDTLSGKYLVGVERPNGKMGCYVSKSFRKRKDEHRGKTIIVKVDDVSKYTLLTQEKTIYRPINPFASDAKVMRCRNMYTMHQGLVKDLPNFSASGSIKGMKEKYYGKGALLVKCGSYIYNVSSDPQIYYQYAN